MTGMKYLASLTLLLSVCLLCVSLDHGSLDAGADADLEIEQQCRLPDKASDALTAPEDSCQAPGNESFIVSDMKMNRDFIKQSKALIDAEETVEMKDLVSSLKVNEKKKVKLELPRERTSQLSTEDLYSSYLKSTLMVGKPYLCQRCDRLHVSIASGFLLTNTGVFVTSHHVIAAKKNVRYQTMVVMNGEGKMWPVKSVLGGSKANDFVFVQLEGKKGDFTPIPIKGTMKTGERIRTLTNPTGHYFSLSEGIVTRQYKHRGGGHWFNIDADYCKGSSGGAIFDKFGNVLGIVSSTNSVYYTVEKGIQKNLQMVFKNVTSSANFLKFIGKRRQPI
ncbi:MAG: serine protease [Planctomycetota bacterium]|nr:serine protease [Planctomycetota bacterium]